jgi:MerR family transcriptional regulator, heat shock protein HspR
VRVRIERDPARPCYVISVAASIVRVHPRTLRIYEEEGFLVPARTPTNIRLYSENDIRRVLWIRHLTQNRGVNLAGVRVLFELEEKLGRRILEALYSQDMAEAEQAETRAAATEAAATAASGVATATSTAKTAIPRSAERERVASPLKENY